MAQTIVEVTATNGSPTVTLADTTGIIVGSYFKRSNEGVAGAYTTYYEVASFVPDTSVTLSANYAGTTGTFNGIFVSDFTTNYSMPLMYTGDLDIPDVLRRGFNIIDANMAGLNTAVAFAAMTNTDDIAVNKTTNANTTIGSNNQSSGTSAKSRFLATVDGGSVEYGATSTTYSDITGAADSALINANGLSGGIQLAIDGVTKVKVEDNGLVVNGKVYLSGLSGNSSPAIELANYKALRFLDSSGSTTNGGHLFLDSANALNIGTGNATRVQIQDTGRIDIYAGLSFDAGTNVLDAYEEKGNWTGAFVAATSGTITINSSYDTGEYRRLDDEYRITGYFKVTSVSSPTGELRLSGLPAAVGTGTKLATRAAVKIAGSSFVDSAADILEAFVVEGLSYIIIKGKSGGSHVDIADKVQAGTFIHIEATYRA